MSDWNKPGGGRSFWWKHRVPSFSRATLHERSHISDVPVIDQPDSPHSLEAEVEFCAADGFTREHTADLGRVVHTAIINRNNKILGCIDQLQKNGTLIRLDGGVHWFTFDPPPDCLVDPVLLSPPESAELALDRNQNLDVLRASPVRS